MKKVILSLFLTMLILSCTSEKIEEDINTSVQVSKFSQDTKLKEKFGVALFKALKDNSKLRDFIKNEALKEVNGDYDVVYHLVKNNDINDLTYRNNANRSQNSLRTILLNYFENEADLLEIEQKLPLLTIYVPYITENSFSVLNWNTETDIPYVAIRSYESDDIKCIGDNIEFILSKEYAPDFPVVVIKDNERLISNINNPDFYNYNTRILTDPNEPVLIRFEDNNFDNSFLSTLNPLPTGNNSSHPRVDLIHQQAYEAYQNYTLGGWQRDFIYYGLTPTNTEGAINPTRREYITSFKLTDNSPVSAYNHIASSQDPQLRPFSFTNNLSAWTDGSFEFKITLSYGAKNSNLGLNISKGFGRRPNELFDITWVRYPGVMGLFVLKPTITGLKTIDFFNGSESRMLEFPVWDLANFSNQWRLDFVEVDTPTTYTSTMQQTNKFNANFSIEPTTGLLKKIGLKFGASYETSYTNTYSFTYQDVSDDLYSSQINFYDNVVDMTSNGLKPRKYNTGRVEFEFRPRIIFN